MLNKEKEEIKSPQSEPSSKNKNKIGAVSNTKKKSVRERINGFPDNWTNTGMPQKFRYFCMGNALVVDLITII